MKISYHEDTDSLYVHLNENSTAESEEVAPDTVVHFDDNGNISGIEIYSKASEKVNLDQVEVIGLDGEQVPTVRVYELPPHNWSWSRRPTRDMLDSSWPSSVRVGVPIRGTIGIIGTKSRAFEDSKSKVTKTIEELTTKHPNFNRQAI